jgi:hypothetical protein
MHMEIVRLISKRQAELIEAIKAFGDFRAALGHLDIPQDTLKGWLEDPDFNMMYTSAVETGRNKLMSMAIAGLHRNLEAGKFEAIKATLVALDPDTWNPIQRVEVDAPKHRFIGFDGKDLHSGTEIEEGEGIDGEIEGEILERS